MRAKLGDALEPQHHDRPLNGPFVLYELEKHGEGGTTLGKIKEFSKSFEIFEAF